MTAPSADDRRIVPGDRDAPSAASLSGDAERHYPRRGRNEERDAQIQNYKQSHPATPLKDIAEIYGLTTPRIHQIIYGRRGAR